MKNRKRNATLTIRLTPFEKAAIAHKAGRAKMSLTNFVLLSALQTELGTTEDIKPLISQLNRIEKSLDRIAEQIDIGAFPTAGLQDVIDLQKAIFNNVHRLARSA